MDDWIVVLEEKNRISQEQLQVCKALKPTLKGVVMCGETTDVPMCHEVDFFPAFCNTHTNSCVYGLRRTEADFAELTKLVPTRYTAHPEEPPTGQEVQSP